MLQCLRWSLGAVSWVGILYKVFRLWKILDAPLCKILIINESCGLCDSSSTSEITGSLSARFIFCFWIAIETLEWSDLPSKKFNPCVIQFINPQWQRRSWQEYGCDAEDNKFYTPRNVQLTSFCFKEFEKRISLSLCVILAHVSSPVHHPASTSEWIIASRC
jgi:hypothetical protein